jgi:ethylbenzene dehydrogenase
MKVTGVNRTHLLLLTSLSLLLLVSSPRPVMAQAPTPVNITSYHVDGSPDYNAPGNESFWENIGWTNVSLSASVSPGGGHTHNVLVRSANDGFNIYVLFRWYDAQGPSYGSSSEEYYNSTAHQYELLNPNVTGSVNQLEYNATYYYQDRVAMLWFLNGTRDVVPAMKLNSTGAITDGSADIWHWQAVPTDNNIENDTDFPGGYTDTRGNLIYPPNNSSFAEDDYTDRNGFFLVAGNSTQTPPVLDPYGDPFIVLAGNYFSTANKTWTVEMVRPLTVSQDSNYRRQLSIGSSYFVGFAVWNGRMGESAHIKSVSQWYSLTISNQTPSSPATPAGGVSLTLAVAAGGGLLVAGVIIGFVVKPERKRPGQ